jgi:hypothetical protein
MSPEFLMVWAARPPAQSSGWFAARTRGRVWTMKRLFIVLALASPALAEDAKSTRYSFDSDKADAKPAAFAFGRTGKGKAGTWIVKSVADAPSGKHVLAQTDADKTDFRFPVAVADAPSLADVAVSMKCKPVSGKVDQACGIVVRYADANNYYVTRANALEGNVRFYFVKNGKRKELASWTGKVATNAWHDYKLEAKGDRFIVSFDGKQVLDIKDTTFASSGKVGLWTKADSVTYFDDLLIEPR